MKQVLRLLVVCLAGILPAVVCAQSEDEFLFTAGTVWRDGFGRDWAWVSVQAPRPDLLRDRAFAVFSKAGESDSPGVFAFEGLVQAQMDPRVLQVLITRGEQLGGDAALLVSELRDLFQEFELDPSLTPGELLSAVIQGSLLDDDRYANLMILARKHPAISLGAGLAHAQRIGAGFTTFELREWDAEAGEAGRVLGRVTVEAGAPRVLAAPVNLAGVPDTSARTHLNTRFRWEEPAALKRFALLQLGFDVIRMDKLFAEAEGYHTAPPTPEQAETLLRDFPDFVVRANRQPVMINANAGPEEPFYVDDNHAFEAGGVPLEDGAEYYYFVAARDLLGRMGMLSEGLLLRVCDRVPPPVPTDIEVLRVREFDPDTQQRRDRLKVRWRQNDPEVDGTVLYRVYKWEAYNQPGFRVYDPDMVPFAEVAHVPDAVFNEIYDDTLGEEDTGQQQMYTVVAFDSGVCEPNASGHSGIGIGERVNWDLVPPVDAVVRIRCLDLQAVAKQITEGQGDAETPLHRALLTREPGSEEIEWAEVRWTPNAINNADDALAGEGLGRHYFPEGLDSLWVTVPVDEGPLGVYVRYGKDFRKTSNWAWMTHIASKSDPDLRTVYEFEGNEFFAWQEPDEDCRVHVPGPGVPPGGDPPAPGEEPPEGNPPGPGPESDGTHPVPGGSWRLYQQVNQGPLMLIHEGAVPLDDAQIASLGETLVPPSCSRIRLWSESTGAEGTPGERVLEAEYVTARNDPPVAVLSPPRAAGTALAPAAAFHWYAAPHAVSHFVVWVGMHEAPPNVLVPEFSENMLGPGEEMITNSEEGPVYWGAYMTGRPGVSFGQAGSGDFSFELPVEPGKRVYLTVSARTECAFGDRPNPVSFVWSRPPSDGPEVPWPARPLPDVVGAGDFPLLQSVWLPENADTAPLVLNQLGIRVGRFPWKPNYPDNLEKYFVFENQAEPLEGLLFAGIFSARTLMPFMVYRMQLPSDALPDVSGDLVQVSPLIEHVSHQMVGGDAILRDPFFVALPDLENPQSDVGDLYVKDTQPVIRGARYQHFLVLFDDRYEPDVVIPLAPVEVPE